MSINSLSSQKKGLITGGIMVVVSYITFYLTGTIETRLKYIVFAIYILGLLWTLLTYYQSGNEPKSFKQYFNQGFGCFTVVTFMMVVYKYFLLKTNPQIKVNAIEDARKAMEASGQRTPEEINQLIEMGKNKFNLINISVDAFGYLFIGALIALIASGFLSGRYPIKKNN